MSAVNVAHVSASKHVTVLLIAFSTYLSSVYIYLCIAKNISVCVEEIIVLAYHIIVFAETLAAAKHVLQHMAAPHLYICGAGVCYFIQHAYGVVVLVNAWAGGAASYGGYLTASIYAVTYNASLYSDI